MILFFTEGHSLCHLHENVFRIVQGYIGNSLPITHIYQLDIPNMNLIDPGNILEELPMLHLPRMEDTRLRTIIEQHYTIQSRIQSVGLFQARNEYFYHYRINMYDIIRLSRNYGRGRNDITTISAGQINQFQRNPVIIETTDGLYILHFTGQWSIFFQSNPNLSGTIRFIQIMAIPNLFVMKNLTYLNLPKFLFTPYPDTFIAALNRYMNQLILSLLRISAAPPSLQVSLLNANLPPPVQTTPLPRIPPTVP